MEIEFVKPTPAHALLLAANMRQADVEECVACGYDGAVSAVLASIKFSTECWVCTVDGEVMGIFGVIVDNLLMRRASLWLLTSTLVDRKPKTFVRYARIALASIRRSWPSLFLVADAHHVGANRFALAVGFSSSATYAHEMTGQPVRLFTMGG